MSTEVYTPPERRLFRSLNTPRRIQDFLETLAINFDDGPIICHSPRHVLRRGRAQCMEGAMLAAAALEFHGQPPLVMDLRAIAVHDDDHVVALFRRFGCWGAISHTNHAVLRYREPVYRTLRELALSFFHEYFLDNGRKTLRHYSVPVNLNRFNRLQWRTSDEDLHEIPTLLDEVRHYRLLSPAQIRHLRRADPIEIAAGKLVRCRHRR